MKYIRITKTQARKLYDEGKSFIMVPNKLRPDCFAAIPIDEHSFENLTGTSFDTMVNSFEYYDCSNEAGKTAAFYIETE